MDNWHILETKFAPKNLRSLETIFTNGNGNQGTRGTFEEEFPADQPATLINGLFDDVNFSSSRSYEKRPHGS
jgi:trehalose/maltose hydrolase-like predicted phosphorylase